MSQWSIASSEQVLFTHSWSLHDPLRPGSRSASSIILRGANDFMVDEMERSIHDALCVVKRVLESNTVVPGGGAVETALSVYLENFATSIVSTGGTSHKKKHLQIGQISRSIFLLY